MIRNFAIIILIAATAAGAARFSYGVGVTLYKPAEENSTWAPLITARGTYWWTPQLNSSLVMGYSWYKADLNAKETGVKFNYVPVTLYTTYHFIRGKQADPFGGAGIMYSRKWWDDGRDDNVGYAGVVGVNYYPSKHFGLGVAFEYVVPDAGDFDSAYPAVTFNIGGIAF